MGGVIQILKFLWASPYTLAGIFVGVLGLCSGGSGRIKGRVIEFHGGLVKRFVQKLPSGQFTLAITLGHCILGQTEAALDVAHTHELVHVRQFERWGIFMGPAYLLCSLVLWIQGGRPYRDNPFEREAYDEAGDE
jgi:hypothetical protein